MRQTITLTKKDASPAKQIANSPLRKQRDIEVVVNNKSDDENQEDELPHLKIRPINNIPSPKASERFERINRQKKFAKNFFTKFVLKVNELDENTLM